MGVASGVIRATESESEAEAEGQTSHNACSHAWNRSRKQKRKDKPVTMHVPTLGLVLPLLLATPTTQFSLDRKRWNRKRNQNAVFTIP